MADTALPKWFGRLERAPAWTFMAAIGGIVAVLIGGSALSDRFYAGFVEPYLWGPIVTDGGYNTVNTGLVVVLILLLVGWTRALLARFGQPVDRELVIAS
ncbi:MAG: hypothetical protein HYT80_11265, partial [Euryarchaeota archaeon]|nr:hypothetical protein [Euryarchaeota archaeon]